VALANLLHLPKKDAQDQNITVGAVIRWLDTHDQWLLILDNADDIALVHDVLPLESNGHILLTTRSQLLGTIARNVEVDQMGRCSCSNERDSSHSMRHSLMLLLSLIVLLLGSLCKSSVDFP